MENAFSVDVLTPDRAVARGVGADSLLVPTRRGQMGVLPDHTHVVALLAPGVLSVFGGPDDPDRHFFVASGVFRALGREVRVLAHLAEEPPSIDLERARRALAAAEEALAGRLRNLSDKEVAKYRGKAERARLRIQLAQGGLAGP